ncbi:hypothetical protein NFI96_026452, partial [Prochilodus magdalenae]
TILSTQSPTVNALPTFTDASQDTQTSDPTSTVSTASPPPISHKFIPPADTSTSNSARIVSFVATTSRSLIPPQPNTTADTSTSNSARIVSFVATTSPSLSPPKPNTTADISTSNSARIGSPTATTSPSVTQPKPNATDSSTSKSSSTVSNMTTALHSRITTITPGNKTTTDDSSCKYTSCLNIINPTIIIWYISLNLQCTFTGVFTIIRGIDAFEVKLEKNNQVDYEVKYMDTTSNSSVPLRSNSTLRIAFEDLELCRSYSVSVGSCKPNGSHTFDTDLMEADIKSVNLTQDKVCFHTTWNLSTCFPRNGKMENSCGKRPLTFDGHSCQKHIYITLPPPENPVISYMNWMPSRLNWINYHESCTQLNITCTGTGKQWNWLQTFTVRSGEKVDKFQPFHAYNCTGFYHYKPFESYKGDNITSNTLTVNITCDVRNVTEYNESINAIQAIWNVSKENCPMPNFRPQVNCFIGSTKESLLTLNFTASECNLVPSHKNCTLANLTPYINYTCTFTATHEGLSHEETKYVKTLPGPPVFTDLKAFYVSNNAFRVECKLQNWNGEIGQFVATILPSTYKPQNNRTCFFIFDNLNYLTKYTVQVYAKNGNSTCSATLSVPHKTNYNDKAVLGFLGFLIVLTSIALLFVLYKIYLLKRKQLRDDREMDDLLPLTNTLLPVDPIPADALVETYKKKIADEGRLFMEEFQSIPRIFSNYTVKEAKKAENQSKNRYVDILPYDYNRVSLSNGGKHDYINASFIEGYKESNKYIAAQGPKEETVGDFWRMIWEQNTSIIVMVTRCEEGNKNKCAQYWPSMERETEIFDDFVVKIKGEVNCPDYIIRRLSMMNRKEKTPEREVTHIQFTSWPDHGVPGDPGLLLKLRRRVNSFKNVFSGPIVIHCSAGVGRTGTYICIDAMIESLEAEGRVDIYGYVAKLRRQRCLMVQVEAQYVLIHTALIEYNQFGETEISLPDFHSVVNTLRQQEGHESSLLELEYQKLPKFKNWRTSNTASSEENKKKNRHSSVVPYDFNRVMIKLEEDVSHGSDAEDDEDYSSDEEDETPTKYINASYLDGYWCSKGLIAAQGPLSDTVSDFLQMLYQHRVKTVVMLSDCTENGQEFCSEYWNDEKKEFGEMVVEVKETETFPTYIKRSLEIQHTKRKESHKTEQYHFLKWAGNELPANPHDLVDMMKNIRQSGGYKNSRDNRGSPVVAHCNDGSSRSGIFCALWNILDSADSEQLVDVFQVAKNLRKERQGMITSLEQYQFLYAALEVAFPVQNGEVKTNAASPDTVQVINEETALISATSEDQEGADSSQQAEQQAATEASKASESSEANKASEPSEQPEKASSESTTNGSPTVTVEV